MGAKSCGMWKAADEGRRCEGSEGSIDGRPDVNGWLFRDFGLFNERVGSSIFEEFTGWQR